MKNQCSVGPGLGPNCLQRLSAENKSRHKQGKCYMNFNKLVKLLYSAEISIMRRIMESQPHNTEFKNNLENFHPGNS